MSAWLNPPVAAIARALVPTIPLVFKVSSAAFMILCLVVGSSVGMGLLFLPPPGGVPAKPGGGRVLAPGAFHVFAHRRSEAAPVLRNQIKETFRHRSQRRSRQSVSPRSIATSCPKTGEESCWSHPCSTFVVGDDQLL